MKTLSRALCLCALLAVAGSLQAQTQQWTWIGGDSLSGQIPVYGTNGVPAATNTPGAREGAATWTDLSGNIWLYGGAYYSHHSDLWRYDISTGLWTCMKGNWNVSFAGLYGTKGVESPNCRPSSRSGSASWTDTAGNLWLYGGWSLGTTSPFVYLNDLWRYNITTGNWAWMGGDSVVNQFGVYGTMGVEAAGNKPGARTYAASWTDNAGNLWLFGGTGNAASLFGDLNDLWKYNMATGNWVWMKGTNTRNVNGTYGSMGLANAANRPGSRSGAAAWTDNAGNLWLFGGYGYATSSDGRLSDLWKYDLSTGNWTWMKGDNIPEQGSIYGTQGMAAAANKPGGRNFSQGWADTYGNFWLFGGLGYAATTGAGAAYLNDLWKYDPTIGQWAWIKGDNITNQPSVYGTQGVMANTNKPGARYNAQHWLDASGNIWLYGGYGTSGAGFDQLNDLWKFGTGNPLAIGFTQCVASKINDNAVLVTWTMADVADLVQFELERSNNGQVFETIAVVPVSSNSFKDLQPFDGANYYRVKALKKDGSIEYSRVASVLLNSEAEILKVFPNPLSDESLQVEVTGRKGGSYTLVICNALGQTVRSYSLQQTGSSLVLGPLSPGVYTIKLLDEKGAQRAAQILLKK